MDFKNVLAVQNRVGKLFLKFLVGKYHLHAFLYKFFFKYFVDSGTFQGVLLEHGGDQVTEVVAKSARYVFIAFVHYFHLQFERCAGVEWGSQSAQFVEENTQGPDVGWESVWLVLNDLGCDIVWSSRWSL